MKRFRYTTLMYLSESSQKTYSYRLPTIMIWIICGFIALSLIGTITCFVLYYELARTASETNELMAENVTLLEENSKLQKLEDNLKANSMLLKRVLNLIGVSSSQSTPGGRSPQDSAIAAFMENSNILLNLSNLPVKKEITNIVPSGLPAQGRVARGFNAADDNVTRRHFGIDIVTKEGTKIYATADGIVEFSGWDDTFGKYIIVNHANGAITEGYKTYYGHNMVNLVSEGEIVRKGDLIALSGNTGRSTGPHIHYEIRKNGVSIDPESFVGTNK